MRVRKKAIDIVFFLAVLIFSVTPGMGQENSLQWEALDSGEKQILAPFQDKWNELSPTKQNRLNQGAKTWNALPLEQKKIFKQKLQTWKQKTPDEINHIRKQFGRFQNLPEIEKQSLRKAYEDFKYLPPEKQLLGREPH